MGCASLNSYARSVFDFLKEQYHFGECDKFIDQFEAVLDYWNKSIPVEHAALLIHAHMQYPKLQVALNLLQEKESCGGSINLIGGN